MLLNKSIKSLNLEQSSSSYVKLSSLIPNLELNLKELPSEKRLSLIKKYYRICNSNSKQPQRSNISAGRKQVLKASGTNRGRTRQPTVSTGRGQRVGGVPNAYKGPKACPYAQNLTKLKMNSKEKKLAIKIILYLLLKKSNLYLLEPNIKLKTSEFYKRINLLVNSSLNKFLADPVRLVKKTKKELKRGPVLILNKGLEKYFSNYSSCLKLNEAKNQYYLAFQGGELSKDLIFDLESLKGLLKRINLLK